MNIENQNAVEENEVVSVDVEEVEEQTSASEIPVVPQKEENRTEKNKSQTLHSQTTSRIQSTGLNGLTFFRILVGRPIRNLIE